MGNIESQFLNAWREVKNPPLDSENPHFHNRFASLKATLAVIREACEPNGLGYFQFARVDESGDYIKTEVRNAEGDYLPLSTMYFPRSDNPQTSGSDLTYRKRQVAQLDWGIVGEDDDDGEAASQTPAQQPVYDSVTDIRGLKAAAIKAGVKPEGIDSWFLSNIGDKPLNKLSNGEVLRVKSYLSGLIKDAKKVKHG